MEQKINTQAIELVVKLVAKTGLYFSCVDGEYADSERQFIENYLAQLSKVGPVDEVQDMLRKALYNRFTLEEVVADTKALLAQFDRPLDRQSIIMSLFQFIDKVVKADGVERGEEKSAIIAWAKALAE
ncbi:MAG: TerB family tellurite resistance protein [Muribaculaceae bacterium]|jgi:hypothetical protein|nr:TerB family tellurite resistance protein [Muribaculaceae bacterium]